MKTTENFTAKEKRIAKHMAFDSYGEFIHWVEDGKRKFRRGREGEGSNWYGCNNFEAAMKLASYGWPEGLKRCQEITARIESKLFSFLKKRQQEYHYAGGVPDVGVFLASDPECFMSQQTYDDTGSGKLARIVVNLTTSGSFTSDQMMARGVAVLSVVDALEKQGRSCEVVAIACASHNGGHWETEVPIKKHGEPAEMERIAFALAHASFYRRYMFGMWDIIDYPNSSYGTIAEAYAIDRGDLYFRALSLDQCPSDDASLLSWIMDMLKTQGIELEDA